MKELLSYFIEKNIPFKANDNISKFCHNLQSLEDDATEAFQGVLKALLIDTDGDPNSRGTARRLAKTYIHELMRGRYYPAPHATSFPNDDEYKYDGLLVIRAELRSMCAHHHQTMKGAAYIGIIPKKEVLGLSKYIRLAQWCARRGQIQEQLCNQIANVIRAELSSEDVAVYLAMTHDCIENRGVASHSSLTQTTVLHGEFKNPDVKEEFMRNVQLQEMKTDAR